MKFLHFSNLPIAPWLGFGILLSLGACDSSEKATPAGQSIARVNGVEITVHQLNQEIARTVASPANVQGAVGKQALENLINQELLAQKAVEDQLDRDPQVMQEIERSKKQLLGASYLERKTALSATPEAEAVKAFYDQHPELFAERKIYVLHRITVDSAAYNNEMKQQLAKVVSLAETANWLEGSKTRFTQETVVDPAERLPLDLVAKVYKLEKGQVLVFTSKDKTSIAQLVEKVDQPISFAQAKPAIEKFLITESRRKLTKEEIDRVRSGAKIEILDNPEPDNTGPGASTPKSIENGVKGLGV